MDDRTSEPLKARFDALKAEDQRLTPPARIPRHAAVKRQGWQPALAATVLLAVGAWVVLSRSGDAGNELVEDPLVLYATIQPAWPSATDQLFEISPIVLPGASAWPRLVQGAGAFRSYRVEEIMQYEE